MPARLSRAAYAGMYGPTIGDRVRLADDIQHLFAGRPALELADRLLPEPA